MIQQASLRHETHNRQTSSSTGAYDETELKVVDIDFSKYSKVVDEFFEALN